MRLIHCQTLELKEFLDDSVPDYAILSHTWGEEEVAFQEVHTPEARMKQGWDKIVKGAELAMKDSLEYIWVDTCCIDKSSSAELSEAINSMMRYYQESNVCYAHLIDVDPGLGRADLDNALKECRWFTRGWTLQELLAPSRVMFYSHDWSPLGTRNSMASSISAITRIEKRFLEDFSEDYELPRAPIFGEPVENRISRAKVDSASIAQRMSWASNRKTTRVEDMAYCLLGIFDINMPLLYGEGNRAFRRLQEEIMKYSDDQSLLAWEVEETGTKNYQDFGAKDASYDEPLEGSVKFWYRKPEGFLATSPKSFARCGDIIPVRDKNAAPVPFSMTNRGLRLEMQLRRGSPHFLGRLAVLNCRRKSEPDTLIAMPLYQQPGGAFVRPGEVFVTPVDSYWSWLRRRDVSYVLGPGGECISLRGNHFDCESFELRGQYVGAGDYCRTGGSLRSLGLDDWSGTRQTTLYAFPWGRYQDSANVKNEHIIIFRRLPGNLVKGSTRHWGCLRQATESDSRLVFVATEGEKLEGGCNVILKNNSTEDETLRVSIDYCMGNQISSTVAKCSIATFSAGGFNNISRFQTSGHIRHDDVLYIYSRNRLMQWYRSVVSTFYWFLGPNQFSGYAYTESEVYSAHMTLTRSSGTLVLLVDVYASPRHFSVLLQREYESITPIYVNFLRDYLLGSGWLTSMLWLLALSPRAFTMAVDFFVRTVKKSDSLATFMWAVATVQIAMIDGVRSAPDEHVMRRFKRMSPSVMRFFLLYLFCKALGSDRVLDWVRGMAKVGKSSSRSDNKSEDARVDSEGVGGEQDVRRDFNDSGGSSSWSEASSVG